MHVSPYLSFKGNCEQAFKFYEKVLGGKIEGIMTWGATPMAKEVPPDWQNKIIHARLVLDGQDVYGADARHSITSNHKGSPYRSALNKLQKPNVCLRH